MVTQFVHVSQFYETVMAFFVVILGFLELTSFCLDIYDKKTQALMQGYKDELTWSKEKSESKQQKQQQQEKTQEQNQLEKSVANSVQNEITNMEKNQQQPQQFKPPELQPQNQQPLSQNRQKVLKFYVAYNAFISQNMSILMPVLIVGMLTQTTFIYSLAAFFCAIFCSIIFDFLRVEQQLKSQYKRGFVIRRLVKIMSSLIILSLFLSFWILQEYNGV